MARILVTESGGFSAVAVESLRAAGHEVELADLDRARLLREAAAADVLWVRLRHRIDAEVIDAANGLRAIVTPTTGLNHVDLGAAERAGVTVLSLRGEGDFLKEVRATAEHTLALMLALLRRLPAATAHVEAGGWDRDSFRGAELHEKTVGIVGHGRLGKLVAGYVEALGARVLAADPGEPEAIPLEDLLRRSDIVTLHASLSAETEGLIGASQLDAMKPGARLVNTARGELVDEAALLDALESGRLAGAALDVLANEDPGGMGDHPLVAYAREHDNLLITPHIGGGTRESMEKTEVFMAERLVEFLGR